MTIWMFAAHGGGGKWGEGASKFYELKLWRTGSDGVRRIQRHFIPCVKDNRAGLYDAVSGVIFYSHSETDLVASSTTRTLSVWRNEADDASLDNAANWCGGLPNGTDAEVCAPWVPAVSSTNGLAFANLTVSGGKAKIPASVRKAMLLGDYGHGKPLTARRIIAVKKAIDADGTTRATSQRSSTSSRRSPGESTRANSRR